MHDRAKDRTEERAHRVNITRDEFINHVRKEGAAHYRNLPWRYIEDPYAVLVSEVMLQQTQVVRVERFWPRFLAAFPTIDALAAASNADVLEKWQGLGYNRRALALKRTADICAARFGGTLPHEFEDLVALPGIGNVTAAGVRAFAWNEPGVYLETNVRTVFIHEFFPNDEKVTDRELLPLVEDTCPKSGTAGVSDDGESFDPLIGPRNWYYALLDFGAHLKSIGKNAARQSAHYTRQSNFVGSRRQKRSWLVRYVLAAENGVSWDATFTDLNAEERRGGRAAVSEELFSSIVDDLCAEGFFHRENGRLIP